MALLLDFYKKKLKIDFNNHTINGSNYTSDAPLIFSGAGGQNDTKIYIENATFTGFNVGDNGIINSTNPHIELTDVSFTNNIGRAINNNAYNQLIISAINKNVTISNDYSGDGIYSKSSIYLNASDNTGVVKTLRIDDNIKSHRLFDLSNETNFRFDEMKELKRMYCYLARATTHHNNEVHIYHILAEYIWRNKKSFKDLYVDLKENLIAKHFVSKSMLFFNLSLTIDKNI